MVGELRCRCSDSPESHGILSAGVFRQARYLAVVLCARTKAQSSDTVRAVRIKGFGTTVLREALAAQLAEMEEELPLTPKVHILKPQSPMPKPPTRILPTVLSIRSVNPADGAPARFWERDRD